jgi:hypothetical protein
MLTWTAPISQAFPFRPSSDPRADGREPHLPCWGSVLATAYTGGRCGTAWPKLTSCAPSVEDKSWNPHHLERNTEDLPQVVTIMCIIDPQRLGLEP